GWARRSRPTRRLRAACPGPGGGSVSGRVWVEPGLVRRVREAVAEGLATAVGDGLGEDDRRVYGAKLIGDALAAKERGQPGPDGPCSPPRRKPSSSPR
ncbi:MAG: hypothetical protein ACRD0J_04380, partial [Acidimicrobiales bacterium]